MSLLTESILTLNQKYQERYIKKRYELFREEILPTNSNLITYVNEEKYYLKSGTLFAQLFVKLFSLNWMSVENPYVFHTLSPSARGKNSNRIILEYKGSLFEFHLSGNFFRLIVGKVPKSNDLDIDLKSANIYLVGDINNIGHIYGSFGWTLSLLDAGHQIEHCRQLSMLYKFNVRIKLFPQYEMSSLCSIYNQKELFPIVKLYFSSKKNSLFPIESKITCKQKLQMEPSGVFDEILTYFMYHAGKEITLEKTMFSRFSFNQIHMRMSDQSNQGLSFFPYYIKRNDLVSLAKMVKELLHSFNQEIDIYIISKISPFNKEKWIINKHSIQREPVDISFNRVIHDSLDFLNPQEAALVVWASVNKRKSHSDSMSDCGESLIEAARCLHCISLFFSDYDRGFRVRTLKNINELFFEKVVSKNKNLALYMLIGGKSMNTQMQIPI